MTIHLPRPFPLVKMLAVPDGEHLLRPRFEKLDMRDVPPGTKPEDLEIRIQTTLSQATLVSALNYDTVAMRGLVVNQPRSFLKFKAISNAGVDLHEEHAALRRVDLRGMSPAGSPGHSIVTAIGQYNSPYVFTEDGGLHEIARTTIIKIKDEEDLQQWIVQGDDDEPQFALQCEFELVRAPIYETIGTSETPVTNEEDFKVRPQITDRWNATLKLVIARFDSPIV